MGVEAPPNSSLTYPLCKLVYFVVQEVATLIEMLFLKLAFADNAVWNLALHIHEKLEHLVVALSTEQYLPVYSS